jgi:hypothetical protein
VIVSHKGADLSGDNAVVQFDEMGAVRQLVVSGAPQLGARLQAEFERGEGAEMVWVTLKGRGPLVLDYQTTDGAARFEMAGPATVAVQDSELFLEAEDRARGHFFESGRAQLELLGAVGGKLQGHDFHGSNVTLSGRREGQEAELLSAHTADPATIDGREANGDSFELSAQTGLSVRVERGRLFVPLARDARLLSRSATPWTAETGLLEEFDLEQGTFRARDGVDFQGPWGRAKAERAVAYGRNSLELFGQEKTDQGFEPVRFDLDPEAREEFALGELRAQRVVLREGHVHADGEVELEFEGQRGNQRVECDGLELRIDEDLARAASTPFEFEARGVHRAAFQDEQGLTVISARLVTGEGFFVRPAKGPRQAQLANLAATGRVRLAFTATAKPGAKAQTLTAQGERFTWATEGGSHLEARVGERVQARGKLSAEGQSYLLTATWIELNGGRVEAQAPRIQTDPEDAATTARPFEVSLQVALADWMAADDFGLLLAGSAHFEGLTREGMALELDATSMHLEHGAAGAQAKSGSGHLVAWDGFVVRLGEELVGRGETLELGIETLRMEGRPARLEAIGFALEAGNIVYDVARVLVSTDQGRFIGATGSDWEGWSASYESLQPLEQVDSTLLAMHHPVLTRGKSVLRANWAVLWIDRDEWLERSAFLRGLAGGQDPPEPAQRAAFAEKPDTPPTLFGRLDTRSISRIIKEIYLEGNVEYLEDKNRMAKFGSAYLDLVDGHGWFRDFELWLRTSVRGVDTRMAVRAKWLRHSADGTLSADEAELTDCEFVDPDYFIRTRNLRMKPTDESSSVWDILLKDNSLVFDGGFALPLPKVHYSSDKEGIPTLGNLRFGSSARFGSFVQATMNVAAGEKTRGAIASTVDVDLDDVKGDMRLRLSYYGSRGPVLGTGFKMTASDKFWMNLYLDGVFDTGTDVGIVRSKESSANNFRWVAHSRARYVASREEWVDFQFASQGDAGVQSEFYESRFIHYDKRDTFLRWRRARDANYFSASARIRVDGFRSDVERLPDLGALHGRTPVTHLAGVPVLYTGSLDAAYLRRRETDSPVASPFDPVFDDGFGDRDYLRADTRQRLEAPFDTGLAGIRVTPYSALVGTTWSAGEDPSQAPSRGAWLAGVEAQTTLYRRWKYGVIHDITPTVGVRADLGTLEADGLPVRVDVLDESMQGRFIDLGLRSRWRVPRKNRKLDIAITTSHGSRREEGAPQGWQPLNVLAEFFAVAGDVPFAMRHDGRYDLAGGTTMFSYTSLSALPFENLGLEWASHNALDDQGQRFFDAMSIGVRWDATPKWQIEGRQTISRIDKANLDSSLLVRRMGHDFIFEIEYGYRAGEGSSSIGFSLRPELGWRRPGFGLINTLKTLRL